jgi:hypothetical protein
MPSLEFTLMVGCPLKCTFCPQDGLRGAYGKATKYLSLEDFRTILAKVPPHVRIDFSGMAEPWANPDATAMLRHALQSGYTIALYTTLYDLPPEDRDAVLGMLTTHAAQIEVLCLHLPDANGNMRGWRYNAAYEASLRAFLGLGMAGTWRNFQVMTMDAGGKPHPDLDHLGIQLGTWQGHTRAGNVGPEDVGNQDIAATPQHDSAVTCGFTPFYDQNVCLPNGDVVLCCMDYGLQHRIGNLLEQDYYDIFASAGLGALRAENMRPGFSAASLCKRCDRATPHRIGPMKQFWQHP